MKKRALLTFLIALSVVLSFLIISTRGDVTAQTETPTATSQGELEEESTPSGELDEQVQILKEKIATKVAELREEGKSVIAGIIVTKKEDSLEIEIREERSFKVSFDETVTKVYAISGNLKSELEFGDLEEGEFIIASGPIIENNISANYIYRDSKYHVSSGKIAQVNQDDFSINIVTTEKDNLVLDIEATTSQKILNLDSLNLTTSGFSKIKEGDTIHFVVEKENDQVATRSSALRILIIPQEYFMQKKAGS